jgi:hypothetical protein
VSLSKLRALIHLATNSNEPGEAESAALQACRYIEQHKVELTLTGEPEPAKQKGKKNHSFRQVLSPVDDTIECDGCDEPIEPSTSYWFDPVTIRRYHGGCV